MVMSRALTESSPIELSHRFIALLLPARFDVMLDVCLAPAAFMTSYLHGRRSFVTLDNGLVERTLLIHLDRENKDVLTDRLVQPTNCRVLTTKLFAHGQSEKRERRCNYRAREEDVRRYIRQRTRTRSDGSRRRPAHTSSSTVIIVMSFDKRSSCRSRSSSLSHTVIRPASSLQSERYDNPRDSLVPVFLTTHDEDPPTVRSLGGSCRLVSNLDDFIRLSFLNVDDTRGINAFRTMRGLYFFSSSYFLVVVVVFFFFLFSFFFERLFSPSSPRRAREKENSGTEDMQAVRSRPLPSSTLRQYQNNTMHRPTTIQNKLRNDARREGNLKRTKRVEVLRRAQIGRTMTGTRSLLSSTHVRC